MCKYQNCVYHNQYNKVISTVHGACQAGTYHGSRRHQVLHVQKLVVVDGVRARQPVTLWNQRMTINKGDNKKYHVITIANDI